MGLIPQLSNRFILSIKEYFFYYSVMLCPLKWVVRFVLGPPAAPCRVWTLDSSSISRLYIVNFSPVPAAARTSLVLAPCSPPGAVSCLAAGPCTPTAPSEQGLWTPVLLHQGPVSSSTLTFLCSTCFSFLSGCSVGISRRLGEKRTAYL